MWPRQHMTSLSLPVLRGAHSQRGKTSKHLLCKAICHDRHPLLPPGPSVLPHVCWSKLLMLTGLLQAEAHANLANALQQLGNFDMAVIYYQVSFLARCSPSELWHRCQVGRNHAYLGTGHPPMQHMATDMWNHAQLDHFCWLHCMPLTGHSIPWLLIIACPLPSPPGLWLLSARVSLCPAAVEPCLPFAAVCSAAAPLLTDANVAVWHAGVAMPICFSLPCPREALP